MKTKEGFSEQVGKRAD